MHLFQFLKRISIVILVISYLFFNWPAWQIIPHFPPAIEKASALRTTIDATVSTAATEHTGASPTVVFPTDQTGYAFYVDSDGRGKFSKTTDGGQNWNTAVIVDNQTDVAGIAIWYDTWTPGRSGSLIHVLTWDPSADDLWYTTVDTSNNDSQSTTIAITSAPGPALTNTLAAGANAGSITVGTNGTIYAGIVDSSNSYVVYCATTCTSAANWSSSVPTGIINADSDWIILMPLADDDVLAIWWDASAHTILSQEMTETGTWDGSWLQVHTDAGNVDDNTTFDAAFAATLNPSTGDIYLAFVDDASTLGPNNDDIKTSIYDGSSWTSKTSVIDNDPFRGITQLTMSYDATNNDVYVAFATAESPEDFYSANVYYVYSRDSMSTWSSWYGPQNTASGYTLGLRSNLVNTERLYMTWYRALPDDLFGDTIVDITTSDDRLYIGYQGSQSDELDGDTNQYIGAALTAQGSASSTDITSVTITETGTIDADMCLSNIDLYYEIADTCTYNGTETLFGTTTAFSSDSATITGTLPVGTAQVCIYPVLDIKQSTPDCYGTIELEIENAAQDIINSDHTIMQPSRIKLPEPTNVQQPELKDPATIDATVSTAATEHTGASPTVVFPTDQTGYAFYVDSDGRGKFSKTTDGGQNWNTAVIVDNQTDVAGIAIWYDTWTPGRSGSLIHVLTWDTNPDDLWYTTVDTSNNDSQSTTIAITSAPGPALTNSLVAGANAGSITVGTNGTIYAGIVDSSNSYVVYCATTCTSAANWSSSVPTGIINADNDWIILMPLADDDVLAIWWDASADDILSQEMTETGTWDGSWLQVHTDSLTADENTTYDAAFAATLNPSTGDIYLAFVDDESFWSDSDGDIKTAIYNGSTWSDGGNVLTNENRGITQLALAYDTLNNDIYAIYSTINDSTNSRSASVNYKYSNNTMSSWSSEFGSLTRVSNRSILAVRANLVNTHRLYAMWFGAASDAMYGNTVRDLADHTQAAYQWFANTDSTDVGSTLTSQDTAATLTTEGQIFRLRLLQHINTSQLNTSSDYFKLQFSQKSGSCDTGFSGETYTDVTTSTAIAYADNAAVADGDNLTSNANDPNHGHMIRHQDYEENNTFTNSVAVIGVNEDGEWDFALIDNTAPNGTSYCFRVVRYDGSLLNNYAAIPEITTATPVVVSITLTSDGSIAYGVMSHNATRSTVSGDLNDMQTVQNNGSSTENLNIRGQNSAAWTLAGSSGADQYVHRFCNDTDNDCSTPPTSYTALTTNYQTLANSVNVSGNTDIQFYINTPNPSSVFTEQAVDITILAVQP